MNLFLMIYIFTHYILQTVWILQAVTCTPRPMVSTREAKHTSVWTTMSPQYTATSSMASSSGSTPVDGRPQPMSVIMRMYISPVLLIMISHFPWMHCVMGIGGMVQVNLATSASHLWIVQQVTISKNITCNTYSMVILLYIVVVSLGRNWQNYRDNDCGLQISPYFRVYFVVFHSNVEIQWICWNKNYFSRD